MMNNVNKKKILFLITKSNWGGAQRYVFDLAVTLPKDQFDVVVALGGKGLLKTKLGEANIRIIEIPGLQRDISLSKEIKALRATYRIIKSESPDVLHVNSSKAGALGALLGRVARVPRIIFTAHGWAFNEDRSGWQKIIIKCIHWITVLLSHQTIAVSHGLKAQLRWLGATKKMVVVNPGRSIVNMHEQEVARTTITDQIPNLSSRTDSAELWLGTIAELHPIKRIQRAIDAVAELADDFPSLRYLIIGDGQLRETLQAQINKLSLNDQVFLTGAIPEAGQLMKAFDIFVLPSKSESYGYVLLEAGHARVATIATNVGGIPDIIETDTTGILVKPDDTPALTQAIRKLVEDEAVRESYARAHFEKSKTKTVEQMTQETIAVYKN